ncbi:C-terminal binding protein [Hoeflea sp.]|uniref:C-terminal binding protein n=1 Tax=Hoeflea sp. TaxID=1940281 RepID=UPI001995BF8A|nr:C-terminal binding protein [Hoeflea sp.]MBC7282286.1 C-terminal binding protein [Hoeflea sp.]
MANAIAILEPGYADYSTEESILSGHGLKVVPVGPHEDAASALQVINPLGVMVRERAMTSDLMDICPRLKIIVRYGVGVDNIDIEAARSRGIYVANVPDYGAENEVSDHALALYLAIQRRIPARDQEVRSGRWGVGQAAKIPSRENAMLGLIGCGRIGLATARKFRAFGFERIVVFDPFLDPGKAAAAGLELTDLDALCRDADVISVHAPLTAETRGILGADLFATMKPTTIVINVARGGLVDETALADALNAGRIFGAGIDVFEQEPVRADHPLLFTPNTVLSDHTAWYSERSVGVLQRNAATEICRVLSGEPPQNWVNRW